METICKENNWRKGDERGLSASSTNPINHFLINSSSFSYPIVQIGYYLGNLFLSPMQKLVAAISIAILILSLYPVLPIASCTRSRASVKLLIEYNSLKTCFWIKCCVKDSDKQPITVKVNVVCRVRQTCNLSFSC